MVFSFSFFLLYRNIKRLREFDEIKISSKAVEVTVNNKEENFSDFWTFVWISSKNLASGYVQRLADLGGGGVESCWRPYSA
jgi:hypothetical protein